MRKSIRVRDLKDQMNTPYPRPVLYCVQCGEMNSAHRGDYFMADPNRIIRCCGKPMVLMVRQTTPKAAQS